MCVNINWTEKCRPMQFNCARAPVWRPASMHRHNAQVGRSYSLALCLPTVTQMERIITCMHLVLPVAV